MTILVPVLLLCAACGTGRKLSRLQEDKVEASIALPRKESHEFSEIRSESLPRDTLKVTGNDGREMILMRAVRDENGEMVATDVIDAAVVTARFRNVAERHGRVDLAFEIKVPAGMMDTRWQLRFVPRMCILEDTLYLDAVVITGKDYRRAQLRGYQQYERFLNSIVADTTRFVNIGQLEQFLKRNIPQVYAFKTDTTLVSDEEFADAYGTTEKEAVWHYTNQIARYRNNRKIARKGKMYKRYVKAPLDTAGTRLDTVLQNIDGDFNYIYVQTIRTRPGLRKVDVTLSGEILEQGKRIYTIPGSDALTFYISSVATLVDERERYLTKIIERRTEANTACYIDFASGKAVIDERLGHNSSEIGRIKENLRELLENETFELDSITISAFASPEGGVAFNEALALRRAAAASEHFSGYLRFAADSIRTEEGIFLDLDGDRQDGGSLAGRGERGEIRFISHSGGENWTMLDRLVEEDTFLSEPFKRKYCDIARERDPDKRERALSKEPEYRYLRENLYPRLRIVKFDFFLHRRGMVKDTVHTVVTDSRYMEGVQAIKDREYERALKLLATYSDYNTAVAYVALDRNLSALAILEGLERTPQTNYLLAILYSRTGRIREAVQCYVDACAADRSYVHRGNLDPEISALVREFNLEL